jgi:hypothetical protein
MVAPATSKINAAEFLNRFLLRTVQPSPNAEI